MAIQISHSKNIVYNATLIAQGDIHIGDTIIYQGRKEQHVILYLRLDPLAEKPNIFEASLAFKCQHLEGQELPAHLSGQQLFREKIALEIPQQLLIRFEDFQQNRRQASNTRLPWEQSATEILQEEAELADALYQTLIIGDIKTVLTDFYRLLQKQKIGELILAIHSSEAAVMDLPWEMILPQIAPPKRGLAGIHLGNPNFSIVRTFEENLENFKMQGDWKKASPLKLLFVAAMPENLPESNKLLEIEREQEKLIEAIGFLESSKTPPIVIEWLDHASLTELDKALKARTHDIVHISGHGAYLENTESGVLYLEDENGDEQKVTGTELGAILQKHPSVKLLMLSACETALNGNSGFVKALSQFGIPAIVGMRFPVTDIGARRFTSEFYAQLARTDQPASLSEAIFHARDELLKFIRERRKNAPQQKHIAEWFTPFVFTNQYVRRLTDESQPYKMPQDFYPKSPFIRTTHSRTIGSGFIGRKWYLIQLRKAFAQHQPVCLWGMGGLGKTTLAEAFAANYRHRQGKYDIIIFRGIKIDEKVIIDTLGKRFRKILKKQSKSLAKEFKAFLNSDAEPTDKLGTLLQNYCAQRHIIFVFDNFEDVQEVPHKKETATDPTDQQARAIKSESLTQFLQYLCANLPKTCQLIFTTRYPILHFENTLQHLQLQKMGYAETYRFFNFSKKLRELSPQDRSQIFKRLDGHPRSFEFLETLLQKDPNWQPEKLQNIENQIFEDLLLEKIYAQLTEEQQTVLGFAAVFLFSTAPAALAAVSEMTIEQLTPNLKALQDWSLCTLDENGWFEVHRLTGAWVFRVPLSEVERKAWSLRAGRYFKNLFDGNHEPNPMNLLLAKHYFQISGEWDEAAQCVFTLEKDFRYFGFYYQAMNLLQELADVPLTEENQAKFHHQIGILHEHFGNLDLALICYQNSNKIQTKIQNNYGIASSYHQIGLIHQKKGSFEQALIYYKKAKEIHRKRGDLSSIAISFNQIGIINVLTGRTHEALYNFEKSIELKNSNNDKIGIANSMLSIANIYITWGKLNKALEQANKALKIQEKQRNINGIYSCLEQIGNIMLKKGEYNNALKNFKSILKFREKIGDISSIANVLEKIGIIYKIKGDYTTCLKYLNNGLTLVKQLGNRLAIASFVHNIAVANKEIGQFEIALNGFAEAAKVSKSIGNSFTYANALLQISEINRDKGNHSKAVEIVTIALEHYQRIEEKQGIANAKHHLGILYHITGKLEDAFNFYQEAFSIRHEIGVKSDISSSLHQLASLFSDVGQIDKALIYCEESLKISIELGNLRSASNSFHQLGQLYTQINDFEKAFLNFEKALDINSKFNMPHKMSKSLHEIGNTHLKMGEYQKAIGYYEQSIKLDLNSNNIISLGKSYVNLAHCYWFQKNSEKALELYQESIKIFRNTNNILNLAIVFYSVGNLYSGIGKIEMALNSYLKAIPIFERFKSPHIQSVNKELEKIKEQIGEEAFHQLLQKIENQRDE